MWLRLLSSIFLSIVCFKQKTAYEMRISDWSSDVCSSDLLAAKHSGPGSQNRISHSPMLDCRPDQTPLRILGEKLTADPSRVVLRPSHLAWQSSVSEPSRSAQLVQDLLRLDEDQAELELGLVWQDF